MDTLSGEILFIIWETIVRILRAYPKTLKIYPKTLKDYLSGIWEPIVSTLKVYPMNNQKTLKLSGLSAQVPDAF